MDRDIANRFDTLRSPIEFKRIALTLEDARAYNLPPQWAKDRDKRTPAFIEKYGSFGWELDALTPDILQARVDSAIRQHCDTDLLEKCKEQDAQEVESIEIFRNGKPLYWYHVLDETEERALLSVLAEDVNEATERIEKGLAEPELSEWRKREMPVWK